MPHREVILTPKQVQRSAAARPRQRYAPWKGEPAADTATVSPLSLPFLPWQSA